MTQNRNTVILIAVGVLAIAIILGAFLLGDGLRRARMSDRAVTVRGLAEHNVTADLATWNLIFTEQGADLATARTGIDQDAQAIAGFFRRSGFPAQQVSDEGGTVSSFFDTNRGQDIVTIRRRMQLRTNDVMRARQAFARQFELIRDGVAIEEGSAMVYSFTKLNEVKPGMIAAATQDARRGAERFAQDSGTSVGGIRNATQGYFSITARDGDETEGSGRDSPFQKVRVVTTIDFYLD